MYARDFRDLVAYKAFSSDYIAVPLLDRESPYVSHCARARALVSWKTRDSGSRTNSRGKVGVYGRVSMDFSFFTSLIRLRRGAKRKENLMVIHATRKIERQNSISLSASFFRSRFPLVERYLRSRRVSPSILSIHHRRIGPPSGVDRPSANTTSFGKSYRFSSTVCRSARLPSARSTELSFLSRFFHARSRYPSSPQPPDRKIAFVAIVFRKEKRGSTNSTR